jgi:hypothetical protein
VLFAIGLGVAGMTNPNKVMSFLDVTGNWDPSLGLVMASAIAVHVVAVVWSRRAKKPIWGDSFAIPKGSRIDARLLIGAAIFGLGWGAVGYCPGPAVVSLARPSGATLLFVGSMLIGMFVYSWAWPPRWGGVSRRSDTLRLEP